MARLLTKSDSQHEDKPEKIFSLVCRNILPNSAKRLIFSFIPPGFIIDNSCTGLIFKLKAENISNLEKDHGCKNIHSVMAAILNSFIVEYFIKTILTGINLNYYLIDQIPIPNIFNLGTCLNEKDIHLICKIDKELESLKNYAIGSKKYCRTLEKIEAIIAMLYHLDTDEMDEVLSSFNFDKLRKTVFCGETPFAYLNKELIIQNLKKFRKLEFK